MSLESDDQRLASLRFSQDGDIKFLIRVIDTLNKLMDAIQGTARDAFTSETATEPVMPKYYATCCKCKKVIAVDAPPQGIFYCGYGCT
jgi:hypothetical protein